MENNIEIRRLSPAPIEFRVESVEREDGGVDKYISGYGSVFEQNSLPIWGEIIEVISRNAFDDTDMSDVVMCVDHSRAVRDVLARSRNGEGTLGISTDEHGLCFRFLAPDTAAGRDIITLVERGDIRECSFAFIVDKDSWTYNQRFGDEVYDVRRVESIARLVDISIVVNGQYPQTSVGVDERAQLLSAREANRPKAAPAEPEGMDVNFAKAITNIL